MDHELQVGRELSQCDFLFSFALASACSPFRFYTLGPAVGSDPAQPKARTEGANKPEPPLVFGGGQDEGNTQEGRLCLHRHPPRAGPVLLLGPLPNPYRS